VARRHGGGSITNPAEELNAKTLAGAAGWPWAHRVFETPQKGDQRLSQPPSITTQLPCM
jgi:hypothetical protein